MLRNLAMAALVIPLASCATEAPFTCEGREELCDRRFDEVAFAATHNSMADTDHEIYAACQTHDIAQQLEDGIRGFMLDTHYDPIEETLPKLCHGLCFYENPTLVAGLTVIEDFLDAHDDAIVTIIFESGVSAADTALAFQASGALEHVYIHPSGASWPTLREMIASNERLVVLTDSGGGDENGTYPWYLDQWEYAFQNPYDAQEEAEFSCDVDRGSAGPNTLFIMNHFLTAPFASFALAQQVNPYASLGAHVARCTTERGRIPNFVTVDFYDTGDLFHVVEELNGFVSGPPS